MGNGVGNGYKMSKLSSQICIEKIEKTKDKKYIKETQKFKDKTYIKNHTLDKLLN